jgi:hypothetical protein
VKYFLKIFDLKKINLFYVFKLFWCINIKNKFQIYI